MDINSFHCFKILCSDNYIYLSFFYYYFFLVYFIYLYFLISLKIIYQFLNSSWETILMHSRWMKLVFRRFVIFCYCRVRTKIYNVEVAAKTCIRKKKTPHRKPVNPRCQKFFGEFYCCILQQQRRIDSIQHHQWPENGINIRKYIKES